MSVSRPDRVLKWAADGQAVFEQAVAGCDDVHGPSRLPGWTRGHVVTHVARNAEGLVRLLSWARTGVQTPMYPSLEARAAGIEEGAGRPLAEQLDDVHRTGEAFASAAQNLSPQHWAATVRTTRGDPVAASVVPWMRVCEVWLHLVDLDAGAELDALPENVAAELVRDVASWMDSRVSTRVVVQIPGWERVTFGQGEVPMEVSGPVQELAGWLTGRSSGDGLIAPDGLPKLPSWR
ncbi:MAG: maleylpyruvate isomerase family mycothiol-dependent enzyme [Pseudonocardiaceae bacterium]